MKFCKKKKLKISKKSGHFKQTLNYKYNAYATYGKSIIKFDQIHIYSPVFTAFFIMVSHMAKIKKTGEEPYKLHFYFFRFPIQSSKLGQYSWRVFNNTRK